MMNNKRGVGKLSTLLIFILMVNVVAYIVVSEQVEQGVLDNNPYVVNNTVLMRFYSHNPGSDTDSGQLSMNEESELYQAVPTQAGSGFFETGQQFIDRIFTLFSFATAILAFVLAPGALLALLGIPWQLAMLIEVPFSLLIILGIMDLFAGGDS